MMLPLCGCARGCTLCEPWQAMWALYPITPPRAAGPPWAGVGTTETPTGQSAQAMCVTIALSPTQCCDQHASVNTALQSLLSNLVQTLLTSCACFRVTLMCDASNVISCSPAKWNCIGTRPSPYGVKVRAVFAHMQTVYTVAMQLDNT